MVDKSIPNGYYFVMGQQLDKGEHWSSLSKCAKLAPETADRLFFVQRGGSLKRAKIFCSNCPVRRECLLDAISTKVDGFWSGTSERERRRIMRDWRIDPKTLGADDLVVSVETPDSRPRFVRRTKVRKAEPEPTTEELEAIQASGLDEVLV